MLGHLRHCLRSYAIDHLSVNMGDLVTYLSQASILRGGTQETRFHHFPNGVISEPDGRFAGHQNFYFLWCKLRKKTNTFVLPVRILISASLAPPAEKLEERNSEPTLILFASFWGRRSGHGRGEHNQHVSGHAF